MAFKIKLRAKFYTFMEYLGLLLNTILLVLVLKISKVIEYKLYK